TNDGFHDVCLSGDGELYAAACLGYCDELLSISCETRVEGDVLIVEGEAVTRGNPNQLCEDVCAMGHVRCDVPDGVDPQTTRVEATGSDLGLLADQPRCRSSEFETWPRGEGPP